MFSFARLRDRVYELRFDDGYDMCMTFLRYQEFYESPRYAGRKFTLAEFMSWYAKNQNKEGVFSYPQDWGGFNIPVDIIKRVHDMGIDDPNHYDSLMISLYKAISAECDDAYLIGVGHSALVQAHELTHAMFHIDEEYRNDVEGYICEHEDVAEELSIILLQNGYSTVTVNDEINAYLTTGEHSAFKPLKKTARYRKLQKELKELHDQRFPSFTKDIKLSK